MAFVFEGVENNQSRFTDPTTNQTIWIGEMPEDGQVQVNGDEATMRTQGRTATINLRTRQIRWH